MMSAVCQFLPSQVFENFEFSLEIPAERFFSAGLFDPSSDDAIYILLRKIYQLM
jgi:hypothetical protein